MDRNYLRQGCLENAEWSLRGPEQLQCLRLLCYAAEAPNGKRRQNGKIQHVAFGSKMPPFLGAAAAEDIQSCLALLFKRKEKFSIKIACLGYFVRSSMNRKMMILRFWFAEWRLGLLRVLNHSHRERRPPLLGL